MRRRFSSRNCVRPTENGDPCLLNACAVDDWVSGEIQGTNSWEPSPDITNIHNNNLIEAQVDKFYPIKVWQLIDGLEPNTGALQNTDSLVQRTLFGELCTAARTSNIKNNMMEGKNVKLEDKQLITSSILVIYQSPVVGVEGRVLGVSCILYVYYISTVLKNIYNYYAY